jgi:hypothetical protein
LWKGFLSVAINAQRPSRVYVAPKKALRFSEKEKIRPTPRRVQEALALHTRKGATDVICADETALVWGTSPGLHNNGFIHE